MITFKRYLLEKKGLWDNIHSKRKRIKQGSGERMRKPGSKGAPTNQDFKDASESTIDESIKDRGSHFANVAKNHNEKHKYHQALAYESEKDSPQRKAHQRAAHLHQTAAMTAKRVSDVHNPEHPDHHKVDDHTADYHNDAKKAKEAETVARESESEKRKN